MATLRRGVIYCAVNSLHYLEAALISAFALRQFEPALPIVILTNVVEATRLDTAAHDIKIQFIQVPAYSRLLDAKDSRYLKTSLASLSAFDETLYLDADILPLQPLTPIWEYLHQSDLAMVLHPLPTLAQTTHIGQDEVDYTLSLCRGETPQYNGGVILWRNTPRMRVLFSIWKQEWLKFQQNDQLALMRAIAVMHCPIVELPKTYNFPRSEFSLKGKQNDQVKLLHWWCGQVRQGKFRQIASQLLPETTAQVLKFGLVPEAEATSVETVQQSDRPLPVLSSISS